MNLSRAKTILIVAFAGLNMFLAYQLFWPDFGRLTAVAITTEEMVVLEDALEANNYRLMAPLDRSVRTNDFISVTAARSLRREMVGNIAQEGSTIDIGELVTTYRAPERTLVVYDNGLIQLIFNEGLPLLEAAESIDTQEQAKLVIEVLADSAFNDEGIRFDRREPIDDDSYFLVYQQVVDGIPLYAGYVKVLIRRGLLEAAEIYWLQQVERSPIREMRVISPAEALHYLVREIGPAPGVSEVREVELGYYSAEYDAEKWEMPPVWRIIIDDDKRYFINAFTGNLEQQSMIPEQLLMTPPDTGGESSLPGLLE